MNISAPNTVIVVHRASVESIRRTEIIYRKVPSTGSKLRTVLAIKARPYASSR